MTPVSDEPRNGIAFGSQVIPMRIAAKRAMDAMAKRQAKLDLPPPRRAAQDPELYQKPDESTEHDDYDIEHRLATKFGWGSSPQKRAILYARLAEEVREHGDPVYHVICDVVEQAQTAREPARWFCRSVILRLRDRGYMGCNSPTDW